MQKYTSRHIDDKSQLRPLAKLGIFLIVLSFILTFCIITNWLPFIRSFFLGAIGLSVYPLLLVGFCVGGLLLSGKRYVVAKNYVFCLIGLYFVLLCVFQTIFTDLTSASIGQYLSDVYAQKITPGGVVAGLFAYGISALVNFAGALIIFAILALVCVAFMVDYHLKLKDYNKLNARAISYPVHNPKHQENLQNMASRTEQKSAVKNKQEEVNITLNSLQQQEVLVGGGDTATADKFAQKIFGKDYSALAKKEEQTPKEEPMTISQYINNAKENSFANFNKNCEDVCSSL